ncbi:hypothetical protein FJZ39_02670 [Candidatus Saccharibacteria bacterium]|nr:hypothetical protein [Candidatus Saccharibacteria bacterium]
MLLRHEVQLASSVLLEPGLRGNSIAVGAAVALLLLAVVPFVVFHQRMRHQLHPGSFASISYRWIAYYLTAALAAGFCLYFVIGAYDHDLPALLLFAAASGVVCLLCGLLALSLLLAENRAATYDPMRVLEPVE